MNLAAILALLGARRWWRELHEPIPTLDGRIAVAGYALAAAACALLAWWLK